MVGVCEVGLAKWGFKISHTFFFGGVGGGVGGRGKGERKRQSLFAYYSKLNAIFLLTL